MSNDDMYGTSGHNDYDEWLKKDEERQARERRAAERKAMREEKPKPKPKKKSQMEKDISATKKYFGSRY